MIAGDFRFAEQPQLRARMGKRFGEIAEGND